MFDVVQQQDYIRIFVGLSIFVACFGGPLTELLQVDRELSKGKLGCGFAFGVEGEGVVSGEKLTGRCEGEVFQAVHYQVFVEWLSLGVQEGHHQIE